MPSVHSMLLFPCHTHRWLNWCLNAHTVDRTPNLPSICACLHSSACLWSVTGQCHRCLCEGCCLLTVETRACGATTASMPSCSSIVSSLMERSIIQLSFLTRGVTRRLTGFLSVCLAGWLAVWLSVGLAVSNTLTNEFSNHSELLVDHYHLALTSIALLPSIKQSRSFYEKHRS